MSDDEADPELLALLRQHFLGKPANDAEPDTGVLQDAEAVYDDSIDVAIDMRATKAAAQTIHTQMQRKEFSADSWSSHELHPTPSGPDDEETLAFVFVLDLLNFSFWSDLPDEERFAIEYRGRTWTGYWSLVAALRRALDERDAANGSSSGDCDGSGGEGGGEGDGASGTGGEGDSKCAVDGNGIGNGEGGSGIDDRTSTDSVGAAEDEKVDEGGHRVSGDGANTNGGTDFDGSADGDGVGEGGSSSNDRTSADGVRPVEGDTVPVEGDTVGDGGNKADGEVADTNGGADSAVVGERGNGSDETKQATPKRKNIAITSPAFWKSEADCTLETLRHVFRSATQEEMPMLAERLDCLRDAGRVLCHQYGGSVANLVRAADGSAARLVNLLARDFACFRDEHSFAGRRRPVRLLKRAQIFVADVWACFGGQGFGAFRDIDKITMFADYRVPQILNTLGCLYYSPSLAATIDRGELIESGSRWELQLRACSIWCVELLRREIVKQHPDAKVNAVLIDFFLYDTMKEIEARGTETVRHHKTRSIWY
ncbi:hypothetical protein ACRALDRAFT_2038539 [Sodiomyces alcalophilus JCM 7366]|uniref:uncharacterized protein n=1 Tax=Sodiomyces alcalophilus JCM 7366 TaxID=591952 RepID=UPI0039B6A865